MSDITTHRWETTRYEVGDLVKYQGRTWEVWHIEFTKGRDRHIRPLYLLRAQYTPVGGRKKAYTYNSAYGKNLRKVQP